MAYDVLICYSEVTPSTHALTFDCHGFWECITVMQSSKYCTSNKGTDYRLPNEYNSKAITIGMLFQFESDR